MTKMEMLETEDGVFTNNIENNQTAQQVYEEWVLQNLKPSAYAISKAERQLETIELLIEMGLF